MAGYSDGTFLLCCTVLCFAVVRRLCFFVRFFVHSTEVNRVSMVWLFLRCFPLLPVLLAAMDLDFRHRYNNFVLSIWFVCFHPHHTDSVCMCSVCPCLPALLTSELRRAHCCNAVLCSRVFRDNVGKLHRRFFDIACAACSHFSLSFQWHVAGRRGWATSIIDLK